MAELPTGTVTLLFTDIEHSTQLLQRLGPRYAAVLTEYRALLRAIVQHHGGQEVDTQGDSFFVAFPRAIDAVAAAVAIQRALAIHSWPEGVTLATRMGLHTGEPQRGGEGYVGLDVHRAARIGAAGHGGQVLLSEATRVLIAHDLPEDISLRDLGMHRLKDLRNPRQIFQVVVPDISADFPPLKTLDARPNNLPLQPTPLIGRERDVADLLDRLRRPEVRLLTLVGPGGMGKTRLGLQVAAELLDDFVDGVWLVELAPMHDPALVATTIASTLGVKETSAHPLVERLTLYLRDKQLLLLLDNFEQVVAAAPLVAALLAAASQLKVLVTSRAALHLRGEYEIPVPPLALPEPGQLLDRATLAQYAAVELFIQRAQAVKPDFVLTDTTAPAVAAICQRLDGLPLAIELAATRSKLLTPQALLSRLQQRLKLLTGGARDLPTRQQTLRGTIDWSFSLLDANEQRLFTRLGVFVGGWTVEAAEAVCDADGDLGLDMLDGLHSLLDKSLLRQVDGPDGEPRFRRLETIREYALEQLAGSGEAEALRRQHAIYYLALAETAEPELRGREQRRWVQRLEADHDNLRAALAWAVHGAAEHDGPPDGEATSALGLRLCLALGAFWERRGYVREHRQWLEAALAAPVRGLDRAQRLLRLRALREAGRKDYSGGQAQGWWEEGLGLARVLDDRHGAAEALVQLALVARDQGDQHRYERLLAESLALFRAAGPTAHSPHELQYYCFWLVGRALGAYPLAGTLLEESLAQFQRLNDRPAIAHALFALGSTTRDQGDYARAESLLLEGIALFRDLGDMYQVAAAIHCLGETALLQQDNAHAAVLEEESLALLRELGSTHFAAYPLLNLGHIAKHRGDTGQAIAHFAESLTILHDAGDVDAVAWCLAGLAGVAGRQGQPARAARLFGAATALQPVFPAPVDRIELDSDVATAQTLIDHGAWEDAWAEGQAMTLEQAIAYALEKPAT